MMFLIYFYLQRQRSHMAIEIPYIMLILRAITERAALDERTSVVGRHTHTHTHTLTFIKHGTIDVSLVYVKHARVP